MKMLSRREFLKLAAAGIGSIVLNSIENNDDFATVHNFPPEQRLGRAIASLPILSKPNIQSSREGTYYEDEVFEIGRQVLGNNPFRINQVFLETARGYVWSPDVQPVFNQPNQPVSRLPTTSLGNGFWAEVSVPYVNLELANPPARAPWLKNRIDYGLPPRFFHSQIAWVDDLKIDENDQVFYRINERFGYGDMFWVPGEGLRPLTAEEVAPISPEVEDKRIIVDINRQTMSCFEGQNEVYFARVSTGALYNIFGERVDEWGTPSGTHQIWRKAVSLPLTGGSADTGWALPAVGWIALFVGSGVAFHSTYWHNNYGVPTSRGCVNCSPDDAKFVFRWTMPQVPYDPGDMTVGMPGGTKIEVVEG